MSATLKKLEKKGKKLAKRTARLRYRKLWYETKLNDFQECWSQIPTSVGTILLIIWLIAFAVEGFSTTLGVIGIIIAAFMALGMSVFFASKRREVFRDHNVTPRPKLEELLLHNATPKAVEHDLITLQAKHIGQHSLWAQERQRVESTRARAREHIERFKLRLQQDSSLIHLENAIREAEDIVTEQTRLVEMLDTLKAKVDVLINERIARLAGLSEHLRDLEDMRELEALKTESSMNTARVQQLVIDIVHNIEVDMNRLEGAMTQTFGSRRFFKRIAGAIASKGPEHSLATLDSAIDAIAGTTVPEQQLLELDDTLAEDIAACDDQHEEDVTEE